MAIASRNPATEELLKEFAELTKEEINQKLEFADQSFKSWRDSTLEERDQLLKNLAEILIERKEDIAKLASLEIGQPIKSVYSEIEKCATLARYYEGRIEEFLKDEIIATEAQMSYVTHEPLGTILGIAPWNFPFWMAFRFIIPTICAGNTVVLKHASNVPQCALAIQNIMIEAGFPEGVFQTLLVSSSQVESIINDPRIKGVSFSGSESAGAIVASQAGKEIKKSLLELGGSDAFIIFEDADLPSTVKILVENRLRNAGQACNSPKRVFVHKNILSEFTTLAKEILANVKLGDPLDLTTEIGPLASLKGLKDVERQISESVAKGAKIITGGKRIEKKGFFYEPTIIINVNPGMPVFDEEVFGPVIAVIEFENNLEAIKLANDSRYGLGASIWTKDIEEAKKYINKLETANVFVNQPVRSDPRLPYGGTKKSGYGRELSNFGIKEFINIKTVVIK